MTKDGERNWQLREGSVWKATEKECCSQLVFRDLSTPDPERLNVYEDVRSKLVRAGVPDAAAKKTPV
jgi:hypothetical protein